MSDNKDSNGAGKEGSSSTASAGAPSPESGFKSGFDDPEVRRVLEDQKKDIASFKTRLSAIENDKTEAERKAREKSQSAEELRASFDRERQEFQTKFQQLESGYLNQLGELQARNILEGLNLHSTDTAWKLLKEQTEITKSEDGSVILRPKNDHRGFKEFAASWIDTTAPFLKKNDRAPGTGEKGAGSNSSGGGGAKEVPSDFESWSQDRKAAWFKENKGAGSKYVHAIMQR